MFWDEEEEPQEPEQTGVSWDTLAVAIVLVWFLVAYFSPELFGWSKPLSYSAPG